MLIHWIHETYLIPQIKEIYDIEDDPDKANKLAFKFQEPWCYWRRPTHLNENVPSTHEEFNQQLKNVLTFLEKHIAKGYMWGWPFLRKRGTEILNKFINLPQSEKGIIEYSFTELQATWLAHYPEPLLTKIYKNITLGMLTYELKRQEINKPNIPDLAEILDLHANTVHRQVMPKLRKHKETLTQLDIELHTRK